MLKNYIKIAWRTMLRNKAYALINILGLSMGIAVCLLLFVVLQFELSYNTFNKHYKNIYHLVTQDNGEEGVFYNPGARIPLIEALRVAFPQVKFTTIRSANGYQFTVLGNRLGQEKGDKKFIEDSGVFFAEPQCFDLFSSKWLNGSKDVLAQPNMVVLDKSTAIKYFGAWQQAIGKELKMDNNAPLRVAGVIEDTPKNSDLPFKMIVSYLTFKQLGKNYGYYNNWNNISSSHTIFLQLPANLSMSTFNKQLAYFAKKLARGTNPARETYFVQALSDLHFNERYSSEFSDHLISRSTIHTLALIAVLIVVMASINFINLSTAHSVNRSKEVGMRKVLGGTRPQLMAQVICETAIIVLFSVLLAILVARITLPHLRHVASVPDDISLFNGGSILFLLITMLLVIAFSSIYPALILSRFKPVLALKSKITSASIGGISLRRALVVAQFSIAQLLIISTLVAIGQMNFVNQADLGFNKQAVLIIKGYTDSLGRLQTFKNQLLQNSSIQSVSLSSDSPSSDNSSATNFSFNHASKDQVFPAYLKYGDADYCKTFGLQFLAGKGYDPSDTARQVVINETMLYKLGMKKAEQAIGKVIRLGSSAWLPIAGVVKDFKTNSLRESVHPIVILTKKFYQDEVAVKIQTRNLQRTINEIKNLWEHTCPDYVYSGSFLDENIARFYLQENQMTLIYQLAAGIAIFISCLGLYGLISYMVVQRRMEVGVRKVLGASVFNIVLLFLKEFMLLIALAFIIAAPLAWYTMSGWLQNFSYRMPLGMEVFVLSILSSMLMACLTVGNKAIRAALANPTRSLRSE